MEPETMSMITGAISIITTIAFGKEKLGAMLVNKVLSETVQYFQRSDEENAKIFKRAKEAGLKNLADHINIHIEPTVDFHKEGK